MQNFNLKTKGMACFCTPCDWFFVWMSQQQQQYVILNVHRIAVQYKTKQSQRDLLTKLCIPSLEFGFEVKCWRAEMEKWAVSLWMCVCVCVCKYHFYRPVLHVYSTPDHQLLNMFIVPCVSDRFLPSPLSYLFSQGFFAVNSSVLSTL